LNIKYHIKRQDGSREIDGINAWFSPRIKRRPTEEAAEDDVNITARTEIRGKLQNYIQRRITSLKSLSHILETASFLKVFDVSTC
jgi:hypothetical protein